MSEYGAYGYRPPPAPLPPPGNAGQRWVFAGLGAVIVAGVVVFVLAVTGVFSPDAVAPVNATSRGAAEKFMQASKNQNIANVKANVCKRDLTDAQLNAIVGDDHATDYSIAKVESLSDTAAVVTVSVTTSTSSATDTELPVVKENGDWKVCLSERNSTTESPTASSPSAPTLPTSVAGFCGAQTSALEVAKTFISFITIKSLDLAPGCVYENQVTSAQLSALAGDVYSPSEADDQSGPTFSFKSVGGDSTITITTAREPDGKYYVVAAAKS